MITHYKIDEYGSNLNKEIFNQNAVISGPDDYFEGIIRKQNELVIEFQKKQKMLLAKQKEKEELEALKGKEEEENRKSKKNKKRKR